MSDDDLKTYDVFQERPTTDYLSAWRAYILATGYPEQFEHVSTSKPVDVDGLMLLSEEIHVPTPRREGGDWVPCPICSPRKPKFQNGRMAWFPLEKAVRFIGHRCAATHFGETFRAADRRFEVETAIRRYRSRWSDLQAALDALRSYFHVVGSVASSLDDCRAKLDADANRLVNLLRSALLRTDGSITDMQATGEKDGRGNAVAVTVELARITGLKFLDVPFDLAARRDAIAEALEDLNSPLPAWDERAPDAEVEREILRRGAAADRMPRDLVDMADASASAQRFLDERNFRALDAHHQRLGFTSLKIGFDGKQLSVRGESFEGGHYARPLLFDALSPVPPIPDEIRTLADNR